MENSKFWTALFSRRVSHGKWFRHYNENRSGHKHHYNYHSRNYLWSVILVILCPARVLANTTVASPQSNAQGVVNNNATMITPSALPQNRYSQGIVCTSPSLTITPYITDAWSFNRPTEQFTYQDIYDEDTGAVKYTTKTPRFEKDNYNLNYGISMQFNIPLGKGGELCQKAARVNIEAQELLIKKTKLEMALYRLEVCSKMAQSGAVLVGKHAVTCEDVKLIVKPNQVLPHTHKIKQ